MSSAARATMNICKSVIVAPKMSYGVGWMMVGKVR